MCSWGCTPCCAVQLVCAALFPLSACVCVCVFAREQSRHESQSVQAAVSRARYNHCHIRHHRRSAACRAVGSVPPGMTGPLRLPGVSQHMNQHVSKLRALSQYYPVHMFHSVLFYPLSASALPDVAASLTGLLLLLSCHDRSGAASHGSSRAPSASLLALMPTTSTACRCAVIRRPFLVQMICASTCGHWKWRGRASHWWMSSLRAWRISLR